MDLKCDGKPMMVYVSNCKNCEMMYNDKAAKLTFHNCADIVVHVNASIICGTLELIGCKNVKMDVREQGKINTLQTDGSCDVEVSLLSHVQLESVYIHKSSNIELSVGIESPEKFHLTGLRSDSEADSPQFVAEWKESDGKFSLVCEKVVREFVYPTTESKLKEARERTERDMEKMANALVAGVSVTKPKKK